MPEPSGCSSARLECSVRDREVGSSNLPTPTTPPSLTRPRCATDPSVQSVKSVVPPLDEYADDEAAALYDLQYTGWTDDLPFYGALAQRGELPSLELMAGTGRVALH